MNVFFRVVGLLALVSASGWVQAQDASSRDAATAEVSAQSQDAPSLLARDGWIRTPPPGSPVMAGYVELRNDGAREVRVRSVTSTAFGAIEIHEMRDVDGVMRMRRVPELVVQPGDAVSLAPGGLHLMLFRPTGALEKGATVMIELQPEQGAAIPIEFVVRDDAAQ